MVPFPLFILNAGQQILEYVMQITDIAKFMGQGDDAEWSSFPAGGNTPIPFLLPAFVRHGRFQSVVRWNPAGLASRAKTYPLGGQFHGKRRWVSYLGLIHS